MEQKYYEIGDKFSFNGETYEVKEEKIGEQCERCSFRNECQDNLQCGSNERKDGINVYFEKVENMELGSFKVSNYATAFAKEVEGMGYKVNILQSENGFNLVSIGHFESYGAAAREIKKINEGNETPMELWVY